jgi:cell division protein FtsB
MRARRGVTVDLLLGVFLLGAIGLGALLLAAPLEDALASRQRVAVLEQQAVALETENLRLERRLEDLDDPVTIELLARSQQGLVRPGEVPYVLTPPEVDAPRILPDRGQRDGSGAAPAQGGDDVFSRVLAWLRRLEG